MSPYTSAFLDRLENPPIPKASPAELARLRDTAREIRAILADRDDPDAPAYRCEECGAGEPGLHVVDDGVGSYDFMGAPYFDSRLRLATACCDADALDYRGRVLQEFPGGLDT